jgi:hypothetical protein
MTSAEYYRQQAQNCLRLAVRTSSEAATVRLIEMAEEYFQKAQASEADAMPSRDSGQSDK